MMPPPPPPRRGAANHGNVRSRPSAPPRPPPPPKRSSQQSYPAPPPPRPPPPPQPSVYAAAPSSQRVHEAYGEVPASKPATTSTTTTHRRNVPPTTSAAAASPYGAYGGASPYQAPSAYPAPKPLKVSPTVTAVQRAQDKEESSSSSQQYQHNTIILSFLLPSLVSVLWWHESPVVLESVLILGLIIYAIDLMNARDALTVAVWISALLVTMVSGFCTLLMVDDADATGATMILYLVRLAVEGSLFCLLACWFNLQCAWLHREVPSIATTMESSLHSLTPPVAASILSYHIARWLMDYWGLDRVATLLPHLFALLMMAGMLTVGVAPSSFQAGNKDETLKSCLLVRSARCHSIMLLLVPGSIHLVMFQQRILSRNAGFAELYDLILVWALPYLLHCGILLIQGSTTPYTISRLFPDARERTLRGSIIPMAVSLVASLAAQQRYVIPICHRISYQFNGHDLPSSLVVSCYLTAATCSTLFAIWTWGRKSSVTGELLFGEYHEDAVQLAISASGLMLGRAFGFPWNLTPLPVLAFLGLSVWVTTRMLRYLCIFLFVVHAGSVVLFSYRFATINIMIPLAIPGLEVNLTRFGTIEVFSSVLIALVAGFAVRPPGGVGAAFLKKIDVPGIILIAYQFTAIVLEITLLKRPVPQEQTVHGSSDVGVEDAGFLYDHATALLTSVTMVGITAFSQRLKIVSKKAGIITASLAISKAIAVIIDVNEVDGKSRSEGKEEKLAQRMFYRAMVGALLLLVMMAPRALLDPIYLKISTRHKRSISDGKQIGAIPTAALRNILAYTMVILPASLMSSVPMVLTPLVMVFSSHYNEGAYYKAALPISEMAGFALSLWGIASLSMINYYLPDGGAETWKKSAAVTFLLGIGVTFSAPTVPGWIVGDGELGVSNPYAAISSLGTTIATQGRNRTGGWGILAASFATLLAITGPLELRERRHPSGKKDKFLLFRMMIFSLLFGFGVSWFVTIQSMGQEGFFELLMTGLACMIVSFFGTVACVLAYFLELENFDEVDQMAKIWVGIFCLFGLVTCLPALFVSSSTLHAFGAGGWLSTYFIVSSIACFSFTFSLKLRSTKNSTSRGLGNASCVLAYILCIIVLYGRYGVSGMDNTFAVTTLFGVSASVFGTFLLAPMLLALEGESATDRRSRVSRVSAGSSRTVTSRLSLNLPKLNDENRLAPAIFATVCIFMIASLYAILLRGSFFLGSSVATSHTDLYTKVKGSSTLSELAQQSVSHTLSLKVSARLAGSGFWTASNPLGPLIHLAALVCMMPSAFLLLSQVWSGVRVANAQVLVALPLNFIPLVFCRGVPTIPAAALVGTFGGVAQLLRDYRTNRRSQMNI